MQTSINISEMRGMFFESLNPKFIVLSSSQGFLLTFSGFDLLTFRGEQHYFKSFDSVLLFVRRHFVIPYRRSCTVETLVALEAL